MKVENFTKHRWSLRAGRVLKRYRLVKVETVEELAQASAMLADDEQQTYLGIDQSVLADLARRVIALERGTQ